MVTTYEFVVETLDFYDGCGDDPCIIDTVGFDTLNQARIFAFGCDAPFRFALRRDTSNEYEGIIARYYAYPDKDGKLPEYMETANNFQDGPRVPKRYRDMVFPK